MRMLHEAAADKAAAVPEAVRCDVRVQQEPRVLDSAGRQHKGRAFGNATLALIGGDLNAIEMIACRARDEFGDIRIQIVMFSALLSSSRYCRPNRVGLSRPKRVMSLCGSNCGGWMSRSRQSDSSKRGSPIWTMAAARA
jgi:hypothetical protein